jgi:glyoxylase-like metal-dependent hydrolase (beta-lactamase superfamily II)
MREVFLVTFHASRPINPETTIIARFTFQAPFGMIGSIMNIHTLDLHFQGLPQTIAAYLLEGPAGLVLIETGPGSTLATLLDQLHAHGYQPDDITHILVTHIHLDHAGAAGWWAAQGATVYVHHFGAPHLIDPRRLLASAGRIYGDKMDSLWGTMVPAPAERVVALYDNDQFEAAGLTFTAYETPGHARHHHVFKVGQIGFTGDTTGIRLPGSAFVDIPAPPPEFDREEWLVSLARLRQANFTQIYPTHFGPVTDVATHLDKVEQIVNEATEWVKKQLDAGLDRAEMVTAYESWTRERGAAAGVDAETMRLYEMANPLYMTVDGIRRYWQKRTE